MRYIGVRGLAVKILNRIERTDSYLDVLLDYELKISDLERRDRALLSEIIHGVIRWLGRLDYIINSFYKKNILNSSPDFRNNLRVALYQLLFLSRVPDYAIVNEAVEFIKNIYGDKSTGIVNAILRNIIRNKENILFPDRKCDFINYLSTFHSHPTWLIKRWLKRFGEEETEKLLIANNKIPNLTIRINNLKISNQELKSRLDADGIIYSTCKYFDNFIQIISSNKNIFDTEYFSDGLITIQDCSTGFACYALDVHPEHRILDMCAAPGGKTSLLSELLNNEGEIIALDLYEKRIEQMKNNFERLGIRNVKIIKADALEFQSETFDRILLDAPCTGLGTISKKPEIKWKRSLSDILNLSKVQNQLLEKGYELLKPGGVLVYSTCTIEPEENFNVVEKFLSKNSNCELLNLSQNFNQDVIDECGCVQTYPNKHKTDGAFVAKIMKRK